jgi:gamma-glutamyltranspeptidase/glutathione hydrolase
MGTMAGIGYGASPTPFELRTIGRRNQNRSEALGRKGMVCTSQTLATNAGLDVLKAGGNAIDAAICANAVLSVVEPMSCGPGGDLFAIVWIERDKKLYGLNASGRSAHAFTLEEAQKRGLTSIPSNSPLAWNVPGCVSGWQALLERFGSKPFADLAAPAIGYATEGFAVSPVIARDWSYLQPSTPTLAETFYNSGRAPKFGEIFTNLYIAKFFESLASEGLRSFYEGTPAEKIVAFSQAEGGLLAKRDFTEHTVDWVDPVSVNYRGHDVWEIPPNGQGIAALQMLNMLENFDLGALTSGSAEHLHLLVEAKKLAYEDRAVYYADRDRADVPLEQLLSKDYAKERAARIDPSKAAMDVGPGALDGSKDTIYLTTSDGEGNMVSFIQSIFAGWGSNIAPGQLGFCIQNRGESFSLDPNHRNRLEGNKRPFHTIIPGFVTKDAQPLFSFGVMGGGFQPQGHVQVLVNMIDFGMSPQQAGDQPRIEHSGSSEPTGEKSTGGGSVRCEEGIPEESKAKLAELGHTVKSGGAFGGYQSILRMNQPLRYAGASDPRKDGCAMGY